ncbi:adenylate/guanylate cyclase domain-containing protein [Fulvivirga sp. RKSG066]|uniref:adenylate/guanylate cyclase domain-containing protein n=1 Tax=Fulvivirga aurantia TaxID=2529383 RepID=UPI0012BC704F|nr:adenylate/guanylate cyclase domain-containing protein [Fulvivirga aurantia]MTI20452.1 adenylate/guanylate cyclase domain-containing protein [Fulvivirga aurantia]
MNFGSKRRLRIIRDYCIGWILAFVFLSIVRGSGTIEEGSVQFEFWSTMLVSLIFGVIFGSISGYAQIITEERAYKRVSIQKLLMFRFLYALAFLFVLIVVSYYMVSIFFDVDVSFSQFVFEPGSFAIYFYILVVDFFMVVLRQINLLLGDSNLWKLLRGKFYDPHEEERIFMFLDLQSSTNLAEKLGHIKYSMFIQDCFNDLGVVAENEAEIYQYVGDEVILTWQLKDGIKNNNCIKAYFNFKKQLENKSVYYKMTYDSLPFFKAGMNAGLVTVTEVGKYKKEIAYHGDAINTAARIQGKCNSLKQEFLISAILREKLTSDPSFTYKDLGDIDLRGKKEDVTVFGVSKVA